MNPVDTDPTSSGGLKTGAAGRAARLVLACVSSLVLLSSSLLAQDSTPGGEPPGDGGGLDIEISDAPPAVPASDKRLQDWTLDDLRTGTRVEVDGRARDDGTIEAIKITIERPDSEEEVKGTISAIDFETMQLFIPPFRIQVTEETDIDDEDENDSYDFDELEVGWRLEVDLNKMSDGSLVAVEIAVDTVPDDDKIGIVEVEAFVESVSGSTDDDNLTISLLGKRIRLPDTTPLQMQDGVNKKNVFSSGDEEDAGRGLFRFEFWGTELIVGGELQAGYELRDQYELDRSTNRDISTTDIQISLQAEWYLTNDLLFYLKGNSSREEVIFDEDRDLELGEDTRITEVFLKYNIPDFPFLVQVGRQRYDDDREWFYDAELDGARLTWVSGDAMVEYSINEILRDNKGLSDLRYQLFLARYEYARKSAVSFHIVDVVDDSDADESPFYVGLGAVGRWKGDDHTVKYWGHYAYVDGVTGFEELGAHGVDFGGAIQWKNLPLAPYAFAGYAWGEGDDDPTDDSNEEFRQSGLQDNNDKLFGVASYRYYGELFRPELANMEIWTLGCGIRPNDHFSIDFVFHSYDQDVAKDSIRDSRLRADPDGNDTDLGVEFDLILGLSDLWGAWDLELDFGYFIPGDAFETNDDPATWVALQIEYKF